MDRDGVALAATIESVLKRYVEPTLADAMVAEAYDRLKPIIEEMVRDQVRVEVAELMAQRIRVEVRYAGE